MSIWLTYLVIPIMLFLVVMNVYFRVNVIKNYNKLRATNPDLEPGLIFQKKKDASFIRQNYPDIAEELIGFSKHLRRLIFLGIIGFLIILSIFLCVYFLKA